MPPPIRRRDLEPWLRSPSIACSDPRFTVRRLRLPEFERLFDLVDETFGTKRPRELYDWLYRRNPSGPAHCWLLEEREGGKPASCSVAWPWPLAFGSEPLAGWLEGDATVAPRWQRQGVRGTLMEVVVAHASRRSAGIGWPGESTVRRAFKVGNSFRLVGKLERVVLRLEGARIAARRAKPSSSGPVVEEVRRFDASVDPVVRRHTGWRGLWSVHDADFLNWRYLDHPTREYRAFAALEADRVVGCCVVALEGPKAMLMELMTPADDAAVGRALLRVAEAVAREADARRLAFFATPAWPHWALLRDAGFAAVPTRLQLMVRERSPSPACFDLATWRLSPGDHDTR